MICTKKEFIRTDADGTKWWQVVLTSDTDPDTLNLTGADVENLNDALGLAAGSILITPTANYIAFEDGVFTAKGEGGGGGGGGISLTFINELVGDDAAFMYMTEPDPSKATTVVVTPASTEKVDNIEAGIYVFIPLGDSQEVSYTGSVTEDSTSVPGITLYVCNGSATFTIQTK